MYKKLLTLSISLLIAASTTFAAGSQRIYKRKDLGKRSTQKLERQIASADLLIIDELSYLQIPLKQHADSDRTACCSALNGTE